MSVNHLMVLLDIYRGTFDRGRHMGCVNSDLSDLLRWRLIERMGKPLGTSVTEKGKRLVRLLMEVASVASL